MASQKVINLKCKRVDSKVKYRCSICKHVIKEAHQASCCGEVSCRMCILQQKVEGKRCWSCKSRDYNANPDTRFDNEVVKCPMSKKGCRWTGQQGQLREHLNEEPSVEEQLQGCAFIKVKCLYCETPFQRSEIGAHQENACRMRPYSCKYCREYRSAYEDVKTNHKAVCGHYPIKCPKRCGEKIPRKDIEAHICPNDLIECSYKFAGCQARVLRKNLQRHLNEKAVIHQTLQAAHTANKMQALEERLLELTQQTSCPTACLIDNLLQE